MQQGLLTAGQAQQPMPQEQEAMPNQPMPQEAEEAETDPDNDPALKEAINYIAETLWAKDAAAKIAEVAAKTKGSAKILASIAYKAAEKADEATGGEIAEDNLALLGMYAISEVAEIAQTADKSIPDEVVSQMVQHASLMLAENFGADVTQLKAEMDKVDDKEIAKLASKEDTGADENENAGMGEQVNG